MAPDSCQADLRWFWCASDCCLRTEPLQEPLRKLLREYVGADNSGNDI